jgi:DNA-binding transcriptional MerR regulator
LLFALCFDIIFIETERKGLGIDRLFRIGELAKQAGINKSVIDHYTRIGLINPATRSDGKYRLYSQEALDRIIFIKRCQKRRLSLTEIAEIIGDNGNAAAKKDTYLYMSQAALSIDMVISELRNIGCRVGDTGKSDWETLREQADLVSNKLSTATEILQEILRNLP